MEAETRGGEAKRKRTTTRRRGGGENPSSSPPSPSSPSSFGPSSFPSMLAAVTNIQNIHALRLLKRLLRAHLAVTLKPLTLHRLVPDGLLALLPSLLASRFPSVVVLSAKVVGAIALCSLEANAKIASDAVVVKCLVWKALGSQTKRAVLAACNAIMDLSSSALGRDQLRESHAIERLLVLFCQIAAVPVGCLPHNLKEQEDTICSERGLSKDNLIPIILDAVLVLVNTSDEDCCGRIPVKLVKKFLSLMMELWGTIRSSTISSENRWCLSPLCNKKPSLAAMIFRLSMNQDRHTIYKPDEVKRSIFGTSQFEFENFILNCWEESPHLFKRASHGLEGNIIFGVFHHFFKCKTINLFLDSILQGLISCPPIASDELDIHIFLNEVKYLLGSPIAYKQDIRVLKTQKMLLESNSDETEREVHFFKDMDSEVIDRCFLQKCKEAFQNGYTIALRGMEFRNDQVAGIADGLAILFGQPSTGANIYITPPNSQGLALHYDDHCVFVCQLYGRKKWRVLPRPMDLFPRLYEPLGRLPNSEGEISGALTVLLEEGDMLYIPRGYPHEADTRIDGSSSNEPSLHLTFGIEVEPPFELMSPQFSNPSVLHVSLVAMLSCLSDTQELLGGSWEGFAHIALHCWNKKQKEASYKAIGSMSRGLRVLLLNLLHVSIRLIADCNPIFRKACLVAVFPLASDSEEMNSLMMRQKTTFIYIMDKISMDSSFVKALKSVKTAIVERDDSFLQQMKWLQQLPSEGNGSEKASFSNFLQVFEDFLASYNEQTEEAMIEFDHLKFNFCRDVVFEDACRSFMLLLERYRKTRKQYARGMLSLHSK